MATKPAIQQLTAPLTIELTGKLQQYVETHARTSQAENAQEYLLRLIREDGERQLASLEAELVVAMQTKPTRVTAEELQSGEGLVAILQRKRAGV